MGSPARAVCCRCGVDVDDWRERLLPIVGGELALTSTNELAVQVDLPGGCSKCGHTRAEIRVESETPGH